VAARTGELAAEPILYPWSALTSQTVPASFEDGGRPRAGGARRGARAAESDSLLTSELRYSGTKSSETQVACQARSDGGGHQEPRKYRPTYRPRSSADYTRAHRPRRNPPCSTRRVTYGSFRLPTAFRGRHNPQPKLFDVTSPWWFYEAGAEGTFGGSAKRRRGYCDGRRRNYWASLANSRALDDPLPCEFQDSRDPRATPADPESPSSLSAHRSTQVKLVSNLARRSYRMCLPRRFFEAFGSAVMG